MGTGITVADLLHEVLPIPEPMQTQHVDVLLVRRLLEDLVQLYKWYVCQAVFAHEGANEK